jgi:hypothetical protein
MSLYLYISSAQNSAEMEYSVYSAYIDSGSTGESHSLGSKNELTVILNETRVFGQDVSPNWFTAMRATIFGLTEVNRTKEQTEPTTRRHYTAANLWPETLARRFSIQARYVLAQPAELADFYTREGQARFPGNYGYLTFSRVGFNDDFSEAVFYMEHVCGLCGGGRFVVMRRVSGRWIVANEAWTWIS